MPATTTLPPHLHAGAAALLEAKSLQLLARIARQREGRMDYSDIQDALLAATEVCNGVVQTPEVSVLIPAPTDCECFVEAYLRACTWRGTEIVYRLCHLEYGHSRLSQRLDEYGEWRHEPMVKATYLAEET